MKKILLGILLALTILINMNSVSAIEYSELPQGARQTFEKFITYLNDADTRIYDVIDSNDNELKNNVRKYLCL